MKTTLTRKFYFEASHKLPQLPATHPCFNMHGHSYRVDVHVTGDVGAESGMIIEYEGLEDAFNAQIHALLDHKTLNDVEGLSNPTIEVLAAWVFGRLQRALAPVILERVEVFEGRRASCSVSMGGFKA